MQTRIHTCTIARLTLSSHSQSIIQELELTSVRLFLITKLQRLGKFKKRLESSALAYYKVAQMRRQCRNEMQCIETFCQDLIKCEKCRRIVPLKERINKREAIFVIKHIKIAEYVLILHICSAKRHSLVKDSQSITHSSVCLMGNYVQ